MATSTQQIQKLIETEYSAGWVTDIQQETAPPGLSEATIRFISAKKEEPEWLLEWRLAAYRQWARMKEPRWANLSYPPIDYQAISYYAAPKRNRDDAPKSLSEVDPELLKTYDKLGIPLEEREILAGVAVDAVFDSVSVATTYKAKLASMGIIFCTLTSTDQCQAPSVPHCLLTLIKH